MQTKGLVSTKVIETIYTEAPKARQDNRPKIAGFLLQTEALKERRKRCRFVSASWQGSAGKLKRDPLPYAPLGLAGEGGVQSRGQDPGLLSWTPSGSDYKHEALGCCHLGNRPASFGSSIRNSEFGIRGRVAQSGFHCVLSMLLKLICDLNGSEPFRLPAFPAVSYTHLTLPTNREV